MLKKVQVLTTVILMIFSTAAVSAQKRQPNRRNTRTQSPKAPNTTTQSPNAPVANIPDPPLIPTYEAASKNNPNRVILPVSDVGNPKGAKLIRMFVRYAYDNNWKEIGHLNEVAIAFGMSPESRVCSDECHYSMNLDGKEIKVVGTGSVKTLNDGSLSEMVIVWMRPQSFKKIAEAKEISVQINSVSFNLTEQQMEGLRQMVPFLRYRLLPF